MIKPYAYLFVMFISMSCFAQVPNYATDGLFAFIGDPLGYGKNSTGGRGGTVAVITTTAGGTGPGTFGAAFENPSVGHIVFNGLSGNIQITSTLSRTSGNLTVHGQTGNIAIVSDQISVPSSALMQYKGSNITMRYLRFRRKGESDNLNQSNIQILNGTDYMVDHCSFSWSSDDLLSIAFQGADNISVTNNLLSESIIKTTAVSSSAAPGNAKGMLLYNIEHLSVHRNVFYAVQSRGMSWNNINTVAVAPWIVDETSYGEIYNNLNFDYSSAGMKMGGDAVAQDVKLNFIGNKTIESASAYANRPGMRYLNDRIQIYAMDNFSKLRTLSSQPEYEAFGTGTNGAYPAVSTDFISTPFTTSENPSIAIPANDIEAALLNNVGASHNIDSEDASVFSRISSRTVGNYRDRTDIANIVYPTLTGTAFTSTVCNGVKDDFATQHGITDPNAVKVNWDFGTYTFTNNHGYENIEVYASWLVGEIDNLGGGTPPPSSGILKRRKSALFGAFN